MMSRLSIAIPGKYSAQQLARYGVGGGLTNRGQIFNPLPYFKKRRKKKKAIDPFSFPRPWNFFFFKKKVKRKKNLEMLL